MIEREFLKNKGQELKIDYGRIRIILWNMRYILLLSVLVCLVGAFFYLRYTIPIYKKNITVVFNEQPTQYSDNYQLVSTALGVQNTITSENPIFILKSTKLMSRVIEQAELNIRYYSIGKVVEIELYKDVPVKFAFTPNEDYEDADIDMEIRFTGKDKVYIDSLRINNQALSLSTKEVDFGQKVYTPMGNFDIVPGENINISGLVGQMRITRSGIESAARTMLRSLDVIYSAQQPDVLVISLRGKHPKRIEDVLNILVDEYNILTKEKDSQSILGTIAFLDERILGLESELKEVEGSFAKYRTANELVDTGSQSQLAMSADQAYNEQLNGLNLQVSLLEILGESFLTDMHELIPVNIGVTDGTLNTSISQYNQYVIERNRLLAASSSNNPKVQALDDLLATLKNNIRQSISNLDAGYKLQLESITKQQNLNRQKLVSMPSKQLALTRMSRLQQVKEPLYILLQQKREEALLTLSSLSDQVYVVDKAYGSNLPIFPDSKNIYMMTLLIGLILPTSIVFILNILREKIIFEKDVVTRTNIPLLGVIPSAKRNRKLPMKANTISNTGQDPLTESFRMLRHKLESLEIGKKKPGGIILQISSSGSWEGKSFISINISLSLSFLGKKVLLVGADLHKPALNKYLGISEKNIGLSTYLSGMVDDIHETIISHKDTPNLEIIPSGPIPKNPSELLSLPLLLETLDNLRCEYDYIIIDSAPFLVVSSGFIISKYVDSTLYIVRSGYTKFSIIDTLNNIIHEGTLNSVMLILNAVNFEKKSIYGKSGIGERYSYGYSSGYVNYNKKNK